jgi:hypothetical protein
MYLFFFLHLAKPYLTKKQHFHRWPSEKPCFTGLDNDNDASLQTQYEEMHGKRRSH